MHTNDRTDESRSTRVGPWQATCRVDDRQHILIRFNLFKEWDTCSVHVANDVCSCPFYLNIQVEPGVVVEYETTQPIPDVAVVLLNKRGKFAAPLNRAHHWQSDAQVYRKATRKPPHSHLKVHDLHRTVPDPAIVCAATL